MIERVVLFVAICSVISLFIISYLFGKELANIQTELLTRSGLNQYTQMSYFEFDRLLCWVLANTIEQVAFAYESPKDVNAEQNLITNSIASFISYFASSNAAIEAAYGEGFLTNWVLLKIGILGNRKLIKGVISQSVSAEMLYRSMLIGEKNQRT